MTTTMVFPRTRPQQSSYLYSQQTTAPQTSGIDISSLMTMMIPGRSGFSMADPGSLTRRLAPVVDGKYYPNHAFDPVASPTIAGIPIMIGTNCDENATFLTLDPKRRRLTEPELRERVKPQLGNSIDKEIDTYKKTRPNATP